MAKEKTENSKLPSKLTKAVAARFVGVNARTLSRWVENGDLTSDEDGKFDRDELNELRELEEEKGEQQDKSLALKEMAEIVQQTTGHTEAIIKLMLTTQTAALKSVTETNQQLVERLNVAEGEKVAMWTIVGDVLTKKDERAAMEAESSARREMIQKSGAAVSQVMPRLLDQMAGSNVLKNFGASLDVQQSEGVWQMAEAFEGKQRADFESILKAAGVVAPKKEGESDDS